VVKFLIEEFSFDPGRYGAWIVLDVGERIATQFVGSKEEAEEFVAFLEPYYDSWRETRAPHGWHGYIGYSKGSERNFIGFTRDAASFPQADIEVHASDAVPDRVS
jgi:hypothetical protein